MKKKFLCLLLSLCAACCFGFVGCDNGGNIPAGGAGGSEISDTQSSGDSGSNSTEEKVGIQYERSRDGSYEVIGLGKIESGVVEIPDTYFGEPVVYIRETAFYGREDITELIIGDNVVYITGNAFMLCSNLEKVTLGSKIELIDQRVFYGCAKLTEITIPASVKMIGSQAFGGCTSLKSIVLENKEGWRTSSKEYFTVEELSDAETVAKYFTETYAGKAFFCEK